MATPLSKDVFDGPDDLQMNGAGNNINPSQPEDVPAGPASVAQPGNGESTPAQIIPGSAASMPDAANAAAGSQGTPQADQMSQSRSSRSEKKFIHGSRSL